MYENDRNNIEHLIILYFEGIFNGDTEKLEACFHENAHLYGDIKGADYLKNIEDYLTGVEERQSPKDLQESFKMKILGIEILGKIAVAKLHVPMLGYNYFDYLSLSKVDSNWKIVNKLFTHLD